MQYGTKFTGKAEGIALQLGDKITKAGDIYEVEINTQGIPDEQAAITKLLELETIKPDFKVVYAETDTKTGKILLQMMDTGPGQWSISGILTDIPTILLVVGIVVIGYYLWQIVKPTSANQWLIVVLVTAGIGIIGYMAFFQKIPEPKQIRGDKERKATEKAAIIKAEQDEKNAKREIVKDELAELKEMRDDLEKDLNKEIMAGTLDGEKPIRAEIAKINEEIAAKRKELKGI